LASCAALTLAGCASFPVLRTAVTRAPPEVQPTEQGKAPLSLRESPHSQPAQVIRIPSTVVALEAAPHEREATPEQIAALLPINAVVDAGLPPQPLPRLLDAAFGDILKVPYSLGPGVGNRADLITLRSSASMPQRQFFTLLQTALKDYGLRLYIRGGNVAILDDAAPSSAISTVLRSRSGADTPEGARTVVQFFQLQTLEAVSIKDLTQDLFPASRAVKITPELLSNSLVISGAARDVQAAVNMLRELDRPIFAGAEVTRLQPVFWSADAFAKALEDSLTAEGYKVSRQPQANKAILILSLQTTNQVLVFANDTKLMARVQFWAHELDQPSAVGEQKTTFVYSVHNTDAQSLGVLVTGQGSNSSNAVRNPVGVAGTAPAGLSAQGSTPAAGTTNGSSTPEAAGFSGAVPGGGTVIVDAVSNRILFTGTAQQFAQLRTLLDQLDVPPPQVMIEVTVAEVTLTDASRLGLEWFFSHSQSNGVYSGGTLGGLGIGTDGLNIKFAGTSLTAAFNAFASNNKVNILSRPRLVARSGTDAQIQVGTDIPIITSQAAASIQTGGTTSVLQTVQYRQTGIILKIKPVVYGDSRIDLEISQEVSSQTASANAAIASPSILNRSISTKISLAEGSTSVLGGLISDSYAKSNTGIPLVKDLPIVGSAFRTDSVSADKTELVILVTPFIIRDADEMSDLASRLSGEMNDAFKVGRGGSYTLTGISTGHNFGFDLPPAKPPAGGRALVSKRKPAAAINTEPKDLLPPDGSLPSPVAPH
jgi:general secretion pathway protein D